MTAPPDPPYRSSDDSGEHARALEPSSALLTSILESPEQIVIFSLDREYRYTAFNTMHFLTMQRIWGVQIELGACMLDVIGDEADRAKAKANFDRVLAGERFTLIERYGEPPNRFFYEDIYNPILDEDGEPIGLTVFLTDITEKRQAQLEVERYQNQLELLVEERTGELRRAHERLQQEVDERLRTEELLRRAQRLEALGTLAGGLAHDFNNVLTAVMGYADLARQGLERGLDVTDDLREVRAACQHGAGVTSRLLAFSRRQVFEPIPVDVNQVVEQTAKLVARLLPETISLQKDLEEDLPLVRADRAQLEQVVMNLVINARDAMPNGGRLQVESRRCDGTFRKRRPDRPDGPCVRLTVGDTGHGIPADQVENIFDPFFTTKEGGKGTGLGLSVVYGILEQHQGWIEVESAEGVGTAFHVYLPTADDDALKSAVTAPMRLGRAGRGEHVLIVEDEPDLRAMAARLVEGLGFRVTTAGSHDEAIAAFESAAPPIDLLFTDVVLPDQDGVALAREITVRKPGLPILFVSGHAETETARTGQPLDIPGSLFLPKPYDREQLARAIGTMARSSPSHEQRDDGEPGSDH